MNSSPLRVGLCGLGLEAYWPQFAGLKARLEGYLNRVSGQPEWVTVSTGMSGNRESFAPLYNASVRGDQLILVVSRQLVKDAPSIDGDGSLSEAEISALYQYYGDHLAGNDRS